jgi:hypothetical protein
VELIVSSTRNHKKDEHLVTNDGRYGTLLSVEETELGIFDPLCFYENFCSK